MTVMNMNADVDSVISYTHALNCRQSISTACEHSTENRRKLLSVTDTIHLYASIFPYWLLNGYHLRNKLTKNNQ